MHDNDGMNMNGHYFGGVHFFYWIVVLVIADVALFVVSRFRARK